MVSAGTQLQNLAMDRARAVERVLQRLGEPIESSFGARTAYDGLFDSASREIPITGPKGEATLLVEGKKRHGYWHLTELAFKDGDDTIDLLW